MFSIPITIQRCLKPSLAIILVVPSIADSPTASLGCSSLKIDHVTVAVPDIPQARSIPTEMPRNGKKQEQRAKPKG
ncbi:hypothetical protein AB1L30_05565 [Bremerella sp. JC817]|uniref:hypothetical protein n=1 Tax=Bremerella sp. JC817 TaxID=3231756 RepID=UPI00345ABDD3